MSDVYQTVTDRIVTMLEKGEHGAWRAPWHRVAGAFSIPCNVQGRDYRGINIWLLLAAKMERDYQSDVWATYKMWTDSKAQVRKGEKSTSIVFWQPIKIKDEETGKTKLIPIAKLYNVFNSDQVDGYVAAAKPILPAAERIEHADAFFAGVPAIVRHYGNKAQYSPFLDVIELPPFDQFKSAEGYYATRGHETVHWTGHASRCAREFGKRFGDDAYAFEELVAELGAAFLCATLEIENEPRADHAAYLASWLRRMKEDKKAIFTAASRAQTAVDFIMGSSDAEMEMAA